MKPIGFRVHGQDYCPDCTKEFLEGDVQEKAFPPIYPDELEGESFTCENCEEEYLILTDSQADQKCAEYIRESVWAFRAEFLAPHLKDGISQDVIDAIQGNGNCEDNNIALISLIEDFDHFVDDAIRADGRGHFLAHYDHNEIELGNGFFAYRVN